MNESASMLGGEPQWIRCPGCSGQIGVPANYPAEVVCYPKCTAVVRIDERMRVLWRPVGGTESVTSPSSPAQWIACHGCSGEIGVPADWLGPTIACPKCGSIVAMRETGRVLWRPPEATEGRDAVAIKIDPRATRHVEGDWKRTAGMVLLVLGVMAFFSTAVVAGNGDVGIGVVAGLLNPLFFIGIPLGWYWRHGPGGGRRAEVCTGARSDLMHESKRTAMQVRLSHQAALSPVERRKARSQVFRYVFAIVLFIGIVWALVLGSVILHDQWEHSPAHVVARIESLGGSVEREGDGLDGRVVAVDLHDTLADYSLLLDIDNLPWIKRLDLTQTAVNDDCAYRVRDLKKLEWVSFRQTRVTDKGIAAITEVMPWVIIVDSHGFSGDADARHRREQRAADALASVMWYHSTDKLERIVREYPGTDAARRAHERLDRNRPKPAR